MGEQRPRAGERLRTFLGQRACTHAVRSWVKLDTALSLPQLQDLALSGRGSPKTRHWGAVRLPAQRGEQGPVTPTPLSQGGFSCVDFFCSTRTSFGDFYTSQSPATLEQPHKPPQLPILWLGLPGPAAQALCRGGVLPAHHHAPSMPVTHRRKMPSGSRARASSAEHKHPWRLSFPSWQQLALAASVAGSLATAGTV